MVKLIVLACSALLVLHCAFSVQGADPCVLDGFDLTELERGNFWNVTLTKHECLVPRGYTMRDIANCTVYFSICKPLPRDICVGQVNSSTCQVVKTKNGTTHYFDIGTYYNDKEFQPTGGTNDVGFATIRQGNASSSALCNNSFTTIMSWRCEPSSLWDHTRNNATVFVENSFNFEACLLEMRFNYSGACYEVPTRPPNKCQLDPYHLTGLRREGYYFATLPNNTCLTENATSCTIYFSFCQGLPLTIGDGCYEAAVCQTGMGPEGEFSYNMGQFDQETTFIDAQNDFPAGEFYIDIEGGDKACANADKRISTRVSLVCDPFAIWTHRNLSSLVRVTKQPDCVYTITLPYAGACLPISPSTSVPSPSHHPSTSPSSGSSTSTKVSPHPTSTSHHNTGTKSTSGTHKTSTREPVHTPTTGPPPGHHTTPEKHRTSPENKHTTQPTAKPNSHKIAGLTAGLVIFVLISVALLVLFIIAAFYIYKQRRQGGEYERLRPTND